MQRKATIEMARLQAGGNVGQDGKGWDEELPRRTSAGSTRSGTRGSRPRRRSWVISNRPSRPRRDRGVVQGEAPQRQGQTRGTGRGRAGHPGGCHPAGHQTRRLRVGDRRRGRIEEGCGHRRQAPRDAAMHHWECVRRGRTRRSTRRGFGPAVVGINGNDPQALKRMLEEHGHMNPRPVPLEG